MKKDETYILRVYTNDKPLLSSTYKTHSDLIKAIDTFDTNFKNEGLKKTGYSKVRIDNKHITSVTLRYNMA